MNWKQFLKPDWRKILVFIFLFIVYPLLFSENYFQFVWENDVIRIIGIEYGDNYGYSVFVWEIISWFLISFILSCGIVWIYDNIRRDWKNFLKLDGRKTVLTAIIFIVLPIFVLISYPECSSSIPCPEGRYNIPLIILFIRNDFKYLAINDLFFYLYPIFGLIISYIFSCFIIWTFDKFRKKQK